MSTASTFDSDRARQAFTLMMRRLGVHRRGPATLAPERVPNGACWDASWAAAERGDTFYVEGICWLPPEAPGEKPRLVNAHAWEERDTPFGLQVVEHTLGYEQVTRYIGLRVDRDKARPATADWGDERSSIIEAALASKFGPEQIVRQFCLPTPSTPL